MATRNWKIEGDDRQIYTVVERPLPSRTSNPLGGYRSNIPSGLVEYVLADGTDIFDEPLGYWTTVRGVRLKKPSDL